MTYQPINVILKLICNPPLSRRNSFSLNVRGTIRNPYRFLGDRIIIHSQMGIMLYSSTWLYFIFVITLANTLILASKL